MGATQSSSSSLYMEIKNIEGVATVCIYNKNGICEIQYPFCEGTNRIPLYTGSNIHTRYHELISFTMRDITSSGVVKIKYKTTTNAGETFDIREEYASSKTSNLYKECAFCVSFLKNMSY